MIQQLPTFSTAIFLQIYYALYTPERIGANCISSMKTFPLKMLFFGHSIELFKHRSDQYCAVLTLTLQSTEFTQTGQSRQIRVMMSFIFASSSFDDVSEVETESEYFL